MGLPMRAKTLVVTAVVVLTAVGTTTRASITGSVHDFSGPEWGSGDTCIFCHAPHNAKTAQLAPLWNHAPSAASYTLYSSPSLHKTPGQPGDHSKSCLSCHDGTVAVDSHGSQIGTQLIAGRALIGTDLANDHPVGISMNHEAGLNCQNCHNLHQTPSLVSALPFFNGKVECATCHDPHNTTPGNTKLLRMPLSNSQLCLHCHAK
jgi:predicted CXXCH cytochrome family protein